LFKSFYTNFLKFFPKFQNIQYKRIRMSSAREDDDILALTDAGAGDRVIPFSEDIRYLKKENTIAGHRIPTLEAGASQFREVPPLR